ncbi:hypothetical protein EW145_g2602 [Phellinidium pouzarii]|uniref:THUMP domain-containing protein n=1 Tax=Phellinidium pouzarii TaxID=167371 RepID=A0A4S4LC60_9AGAM|nr:hypothetical protein EW145_g2602 [Phellinidium pouzarii]
MPPDHRRRDAGRKRYRSDGSSLWTRRNIDGPGVWVTCLKGKEKQTVGEVYDLFESLADELWPTGTKEPTGSADGSSDAESEKEEDLEKAIAKEVQRMKQPRKQQRFANCSTDTPCIVFISCKPPIDPVIMVESHMKNIERTGITHTRSTQRLVPISNSCDCNIPEIISLCRRIVAPAFSEGNADVNENTDSPKVYRYKIELRMRNHNTLSRDDVIKTIAQCVPAQHKVDLVNAELFILVEIFKATCGMSIVRDYYCYKKFNVIEVSQARLAENEGMAE